MSKDVDLSEGEPVVKDPHPKRKHADLKGARMPLLDAIPAFPFFPQQMEGTMDDGIDLSEVPVCPRCGLEMADQQEHELWHHLESQKIRDLENKVYQLEVAVKSLMNQLISSAPVKDTQEEINKYSQKNNNLYNHPPKKPPKKPFNHPWAKK